jgi:hypothetical protein
MPTNEDAPLCATTGHRIKVVYYKPSGPSAATPQIESDLRSIVNRMNWKIRSQALLSSNNNIPLEMKVDCDSAGQVRVYSLQTKEFSEIYSAFGKPKGSQAVKYLVFLDGNGLPAGESNGRTSINHSEATKDPRFWTKSASDEPVGEGSQSNYNRVESHWAKIWRSDSQGRDFWHSHVPLHELFHSMGAVQLGPENDPNVGAVAGGHCNGNIDVMCEPGLFGSEPCPPGQSEPGGAAYETPVGDPLDCHFDNYFDAQPEPGEWLSRNWNVAGPENPYLANPNTYVPQAKPGLDFDLASSGPERLDLVVRVPDSSLRYRARTNGTWATKWTALGGSLTGAPVLISPEAGRLDVFACSYDGTVVHRVFAASAWGAWQALGSAGSGCSGLDAVSWGPGRLDVVVRDGANLYHRSMSGETWSGWTTLANAGTFSVSSLPTLVSRKPGELTLFVRNGSSDIQARAFANNAWGSWESLGSPVSGTLGVPEAVASESTTQPVGTAHVFAHGGWDFGAWGRTIFNGGMSLWRYFEGERGNGKYAAVARPDQAIDLYGIDTSGRVQARRKIFEATSTWQDLGGQFREVAPEATAIGTGGEWLNAVGALGEDGKLYIGDDGAPGWSGWKQVVLPEDVSEKEAFDIPDGRPWEIRPTPLPNPTSIRHFEGVSCAAPDACLAVGHYSSEYADALRWDGIHWTDVSGPPLPTGAQSSTLQGVACASPTLCTAVGQYRNSSGVSLPWALRWNGSTWTSQGMPSLGGDAFLSGISCTGAETCTAVGDYVAGGEHEPLVLRWTGGPNWTQAGLTGPVGDAYLKGVSCSSASDCRAVGYYHSASGWRMIAAGGSGATWNLQYPPHPAGATLSHLYSVSCTAVSSCTAVGITQDAENLPHALVMRWDGSAWTAQSTPAPPGSTQTALHAVSCVSSSSCVATGLRSGLGVQSPLAMRWDGTSWSVEPTPSPSGTLNYVGLYGVSCTYPTACMAVGWQQVSASEQVPLTERLQGGPPSIATQGVTGVAKKQATLRSWVNPNGLATNYRFEWGTTTAYGSSAPATPSAVGSGLVDTQVENQISGLVGEQAYHYRLVAENSEGTTFGPDQQFTTPMWKPTVTVEAPTAIGSGGATLRGTVNPNGFATTYQFEWGATTAYGSTVPLTPKSIGSEALPLSVSEAISGLTGAKTYHYRIMASNSEGTSYSSDQVLTTPDWKPKVTTNPASAVLRESAFFNATVNPSGFATTYQFQYGTTKEFGTTVPATPVSAGSGTTGVPANLKVTALKPFTTYYYRVVATNAEGTTNGETQVFRTYANNFWTEKAPATLFGETSGGGHLIITGALKLFCAGVAYSGSREIPNSEILTLLPSYSKCTVSGSLSGSTAVSMGGCKLELDVDGIVVIAGATCATAPITYSIVFSTLKCTISIGPQTLLGLGYEVTGSGKERKILATQQLTGLKYTATGSICPKVGTFADGTYTGTSLLRAQTQVAEPQGLWAE